MKNQPVLSVCIPTYNRNELLAKALDRICRQVSILDRPDRIEIIISDNASTDNTVSFVATYIEENQHLNIRLISHPVNVGMDGNFNTCYQVASGEYVCLMSDDDFLCPGSLAFLLDSIEENYNIGAIFLNPFPINGCVSFKNEKITEFDAVLKRVGNRLFHLGAFAFKRSIFESKDYSDYIGSFLLISYVFADVVSSGEGVLFSDRSFYEITQNNSGGYNFFEVFVTNYCTFLKEIAPKCADPSTIKLLSNQHLRYFVLPFVLDLRLNNSYSRMSRNFLEGYYLLLKNFGLSKLTLLYAPPIFFMPISVWKVVRRLVRLVRSLR